MSRCRKTGREIDMKLRYVVIGAITALALYGLGRREAKISQELALWKHNAQDALQARSGYIRSLDSLRGLERALRARQDVLRGDLRRLASHAESLSTIADTAQTVEPVRAALLGSQAAYAT